MRHGETEANRLGIVQGHNTTPLAETGIQQARKSAKAIAHTPFSHIYCSDLVRTRQTVEPLIALRGSDTVIYDARLREKGAGVAEGIKLAALHKMQKDSGESVRTYRPEGGESWDEVRARADSFFQHLLDLMRQGVRGPVLVVTHGGVYVLCRHRTLFVSQSPPKVTSWRWSTRSFPTSPHPTAPRTFLSPSCKFLSRYIIISAHFVRVCPHRVAIQPHILFPTLQRVSQGTGRLRTHVLKWADVSYMQDKVRALFCFDSGLQLLICSKDAPACTASGGDNA